MQVKNIPVEERIIFALDVSGPEEAKGLVNKLESEITFFKVGLQLFLAGGFSVVEWITSRGHKVMLDLKFYDIPRTVEMAVRQLEGRDITFTTVHGNRAIMEAAARAAGKTAILAVTVLTSLGEEEMRQMGASVSIEELVVRRAIGAKESGCRGIVCSPREASSVRKAVGPELVIVTPGIRMADRAELPNDDQVRFATPYAAILNGSDYLVVGRPIRDAKDPSLATKAIKAEISRAIEDLNR